MPSALLVLGGAHSPPPLARDLQAAGIKVVGTSNGLDFTQLLVGSAPDLVILHQDAPDAALFDHAATVGRLQPKPVIVFTLDPDADNIARAMVAGVHAYVIDGYNPARLRSVIHLAQARFQHDRLLREELAQVSQRFEERKLVDRAKGILMGARQLREDEAYRVLRRVATDTKQRIGQVSHRVIEAARYGEAINRAGQLRMLSQRAVKLYALNAAGVWPDETAALLADSAALIEDTLGILTRTLSLATFGDLVDGVVQSWAVLRAALQPPGRLDALQCVDEAAELVLHRSEHLTDNLEVSGFAQALHAINVAGRQRMLSQRLAKATLLGNALRGEPAQAARIVAAQTAQALTDGLAYLRELPLTNPEITADLEQATRSWGEFEAALTQCRKQSGLELVADLSEDLLDQFDRLTIRYERAMQAFVN